MPDRQPVGREEALDEYQLGHTFAGTARRSDVTGAAWPPLLTAWVVTTLAANRKLLARAGRRTLTQ